MILQPDIAEAKRFLRMIAPDGNVVFQTFDDIEERKDSKLAWTTREFDKLPAMQAKQAGVFVTINEVEGNRRKADKVVRVRSLFTDFDGTELPSEWGLEPSALVNTSPAKFHAYWFCEDFPLEEFADAQRALAAHFGTDPKVCDLPRVMRLPGFWHQKGDPYQARIIEATGRVYSKDELREWIAHISPAAEVEKPIEVRRSTLNGSTPVYVKVGVEKALASIAVAGKGNRNDTLNSEAYGIFGFVKAGLVPESIRGEIESVALSIGLTKSEIKATLKSAWDAAKARSVPASRFERREELPPHDPDTGEVIEEKPKKAKKPARVTEAPFRMLGHNKGTYFYLPEGGGQVVALKAHEHTPLRLLALASLNYWEGLRNNADSAKISEHQWQQFANSMIQTQNGEGIFEETRMRGRGAWMDGKRVVVHTGSEVIIDGQATALTRINSRFVYEAASPWEFGFSDPATTQEAYRLVEICGRISWEDPLSGSLLAGWCVVATVSGALRWRPHIWAHGSAGSGKTTVINDIVGRVVGPSAIKFEGKTTEAAIRQTMGYDARTVILDEAEGEDVEAAKRMQGVLDLARVSSSGGMISKGSSNHRAVNFVVRSCFCFSSIHASIKFHADESRITRLGLRRNSDNDRDEQFRQLMLDIEAWFTPEYASRMFARTVKYLPVLLANVEKFTTVAAIVLGSRRAADQLGAMLAGLYLCHSTELVTTETAEAFIRKHTWNEHLSLDSQDDETRLFRYIMSRTIRVLTNDGQRDMTIGQALDDGKYLHELAPIGIRLDGEFIAIANRSDKLEEMLRDKPHWASDWKNGLLRLPGAQKTTAPIYFAPGLNQRATLLPRELLRG